MKWVYDDGGRSKYYKGTAGDCFVRATAIATGLDYKYLYDLVNEYAKKEHVGCRKRGVSNARAGVYSRTAKKILEDLGWKWTATTKVGQGVSMHLVEDEVPSGTVICNISKHFVCVIDGVIHDTYNSSEKQYFDQYGNLAINDRRAVYGYWTKEA